MNINALWLIFIIPFSIAVGAGLTFWYITYQIRKAMGIKSWKEFIKKTKEAQILQKKMEREGIFGVMNDPKLKKQMEELQKRFGGKAK